MRHGAEFREKDGICVQEVHELGSSGAEVKGTFMCSKVADVLIALTVLHYITIYTDYTLVPSLLPNLRRVALHSLEDSEDYRNIFDCDDCAWPLDRMNSLAPAASSYYLPASFGN